MTVLWHPALRERVHTARAGAPIEPGSARILIERWYPAWIAHGYFTAWWDHLAPPNALSAAYRKGDIDWTEFAYEYLAHFDDIQHPGRYWQWVSSDVAGLLRQYDSVTFIGARPAPDGDERAVRCHRRLLVAWLRGDDISLGIDA